MLFIKIIIILYYSVSLSADMNIANQSNQDLDNMPSSSSDDIKVFQFPLVLATEDALAGFGNIVTHFKNETVKINTWPRSGWRPVLPGTGTGGGIVDDDFTLMRKGNLIYARNDAVGREYITGWFDDPAQASLTEPPTQTQYVLTHEANFHPDGGQVFFPKDGQPFVALLAKPGDDISPHDFVAFYFKGDFGVQIHPGVWHQPMFPVNEQAQFHNKQGAVHACIGVDFVEEFGGYLKVPLSLETN